MNQRAFSGIDADGSLPATQVDVKPRPVSVRRKGRVFQLSKKPSNTAIFLVSFLTYLIGIFPSMVFALPSNGTVQAGSATINQPTSQQMVIQQTTDKAIIDWQDFSIGSSEQVDFQLSQGGVTLNRVTGNDVSQIFGKLTSNGDLWLINPNGILFGANAQVDVNGLLATTSDISNTDFLNNNYNFGIPSSLSSTVVNQGSITAAEGGLVALVAPGVQNMGIINARLGKVSLASGKTFTVDLYGDQLINLGVDSQVMGQVTGMDGEVLSSLVSNSGSIFADGGVVRLDVNAAQNIVDRVINMDGVIQAQSVSEQNGAIILSGGEEGEVHVTGTLDASGYDEGETGGTVHVLGDRLAFYGDGLIDVSGDLGGGTLLFGGDYQGQGLVPNADEVFIGSDTRTLADAVTNGNGGKVIFWADRRMRFYGIVRGRGGKYFGDGGLVEVSGKEELYFDGTVDTTAVNGKTGTLLLDPDKITIVDKDSATPATDDAFSSGAISFSTNTSFSADAVIKEDKLESLSATTNIILLATTLIKMENLVDNTLDLKQTTGHSVTFTVTNGSISFDNTLDTISTQGGDIIFSAEKGTLTLGNLTSNGGDILLTGNDFTLGGSSNLAAGAGNISITGTQFGEIGFGNSATCSTTCAMLIDSTELGQMSGNKLIINGSSKNGAIYVNGLTASQTSGFSNGVELVDAHVSGGRGGIFFQGASEFTHLNAKSLSTIQVDGNLSTTVGSLSLDGDSDNGLDSDNPRDNISIASGVTLTSAGAISLSAKTGGISAASGLTLNAPTSISLTGTLTAAGSVNLTANSGININGGIQTTSGGLININANSSALSFGNENTILNSILNSAGTLTLSASSISSAGNLTTSSTGTTDINTSLTSAGFLSMSANGLTLTDNNLSVTGDISLQGGSTGLSLASNTAISSSAGSITLGASGGTIAANGGLTLNSLSGVTVENSLTATGTVNIDADTDNNGSGDFTISSGGSLTTGNNALTVTANDMTLAGSLDSGTGSTTINVSDGGSLGIGLSSGFGMNIDSNEQGRLLGTGDINLVNSNITFSAGNSFSSSGNLNIGQSGGTITGQGALTLTGANGLVINSNTVSTAGNLILGNGAGTDASISLASGTVLTATGGSITLNATTGGTSAAGAVTFNADGIDLKDSLTSAGTATFDAGTGTFTTTSGKALSAGNNAISITATDLTLGGTVSSGNQGTTILASSGGTIGLGTAGGSMSLSDAELGNISAGSLTIGNGTNGSITVDGITFVNSDQFGALTLNATASGSSVAFGTASSFGQGLTVNAADGISIASGLTTNGATTFNADTDDINTGDFTLTTGSVSAGNNSITINSNGITLDGTLSSGNASTTIQASRADTTIGLGDGAGTFSLLNAELGRVTAGSLAIGDGTNGTITVDGVTLASTPLTLNAGSGAGAVNFSTNASSFDDLTVDAGTGGVSFGATLSAGNLSVTSGGAITDTGTLTITGTSSFTTDVANQAITLDNSANTFTGAVSLNTSGNANATLTSDNAVTLSTSNVGGDLNVTVGGDNSLNVTGAGSSGGAINLLADDDIIFTAAGDLSTTANGNISVTADNDLDKNGSGGALTMVDGTVFNSGSGVIKLSADEDITIGRVETGNSSDAAVTLTSFSGGLVDGDTALPPEFTSLGGDSSPWLDIDAANGRLVADLATGFGGENPIETRVQSVDIDNSTSGKVDIFEFDTLDIFNINNAGGSVEISFEGELTGLTNCVGACLFVRRDIRNALIGSKTLGQLANASNEQMKFDVFELQGPNFLEKSPVDHIAGSPNGPFTVDLFSEQFELVELAAGTDGKFEGMEVSQTFWGKLKQPTLEVVEWNAPENKKNRSRERSAKRKKRAGRKVDDTASITMNKAAKKATRIQKSESGYLGYAP